MESKKKNNKVKQATYCTLFHPHPDYDGLKIEINSSKAPLLDAIIKMGYSNAKNFQLYLDQNPTCNILDSSFFKLTELPPNLPSTLNRVRLNNLDLQNKDLETLFSSCPNLEVVEINALYITTLPYHTYHAAMRSCISCFIVYIKKNKDMQDRRAA